MPISNNRRGVNRLDFGSTILGASLNSLDPGTAQATGLRAVPIAVRVNPPLSARQPPVLSGIAKTSADVPIPGAFVRAHRVGDGMPVGSAIADGAGAFTIPVTVSGPFQIVCYLKGAPDLAGVSADNLEAGPNG
ncbi:MAG: hypothetical protein ACRCU1_03520 [Alsobacter sp.]